MKIVFAADSHGRFDRLEILLSRLRDAGIVYFFHAGDFAVYGVADILKKFSEISIFISEGNSDVNSEILKEVRALPNVKIQEVIYEQIEGVGIGMSHYEGVAQNVLRGKKVDLFFHGHTHRAKKEQRDGKLVLNPGAIEEDGHCFLVDVTEITIRQKFFNDAF